MISLMKLPRRLLSFLSAAAAAAAAPPCSAAVTEGEEQKRIESSRDASLAFLKERFKKFGFFNSWLKLCH